MVGDHGNSICYEKYKKEISKNALMMIFFCMNKKYVGYNDDCAQQIDIFPTIMDIIGYQKPFRGWGRSLVSKSEDEPFAITWSGSFYEYMEGNYIVTFDGKAVTGFYDKIDKDLKTNLLPF